MTGLTRQEVSPGLAFVEGSDYGSGSGRIARRSQGVLFSMSHEERSDTCAELGCSWHSYAAAEAGVGGVVGSDALHASDELCDFHSNVNMITYSSHKQSVTQNARSTFHPEALQP